jgi:tRNA 2-thiouridine synthesizing protein E
MEVLMNNKAIELNGEGYLVNFNQWDKNVAEGIAREENIELSNRHWEVLEYLQKCHLDKEPLSIRKVGKSGVVDIKEFYQLFPNGPLKTATKIAGIPKPVSCI